MGDSEASAPAVLRLDSICKALPRPSPEEDRRFQPDWFCLTRLPFKAARVHLVQSMEGEDAINPDFAKRDPITDPEPNRFEITRDQFLHRFEQIAISIRIGVHLLFSA
jgi:hypothetical protein